MSDKLISQLDASGANLQDVDEIEGQINGESQTKKFTGAQMREVEKAEREAQDDVIEAGCGLNADGTYPSLTDSWGLRLAEFVAGITDRGGATGALTENIMNALRILDARIYNIGSLIIKDSGISGDTTFLNKISQNYMLEYMIFEETAGNQAILDLGTAPSGKDVFWGNVIEASTITTIYLGRTFSFSADQTLYLNDDDAGSSWNGANVNINWIVKLVN